MLDLRFALYWQAASVLGMLLVFTATLIPPHWLWPTDTSAGLQISDKLLHGMTFAFLAVWFCGQYARRAYWRVVIGLLAFGILIEISQRMVAYRSAEFLDIAANLAGISSGLLLAFVGLGGWSLRFENWIGRRFE